MKVVALDFESNSLEYWSKDFKVVSCAFSWRFNDEIVSKYIEGEEHVGEALRSLATKSDLAIVVHNLSFDLGIIMYRFPDVQFKTLYDTMRLSQLLDPDAFQGMSLVKCIERNLPPSCHNHKEPYFEWIRNNLSVKKGEEGEYLSQLPKNMLAEYNVKDTEYTLMLFEELMLNKYDGLELDRQLYTERCKFLIKAKAGGILINRDKLMEVIHDTKMAIDTIEREFLDRYRADIATLRGKLADAYINSASIKTERGREKRRQEVASGGWDWQFNIYSTKDLYLLFVTVMGMKVPRMTKSGKNPSLSVKHLHLWGEPGKMLTQKGRLRTRLTQAESLLELSSKDRRWHADIRPTGVKTGRISGGEV